MSKKNSAKQPDKDLQGPGAKFFRIERAQAVEISNFLFALGNQFIDVANSEGAFDCFKFSLDLNPKNQPAVYNLGTLYSVMGNHEGAYRMFREAGRMKPDDMMSRVALSEVARKLQKFDEAQTILDLAFKLDPDNYLAMSAQALLHYDNGRLAEALDWNDRALAYSPGDVHMVLNRTLISLLFGNWVDHWIFYEHCLSYQKNEKMHGLKMKDAWDGREMPGKHLMVISDQGSGDAIQFSRYLKDAKALGKFDKLTFLVKPEVASLLARVEGIDAVGEIAGKLTVKADAFSSLLGIMRILKISPENCYRDPHIRLDPALTQVWKSRINAMSVGALRIGIVWAGDPRHGNDRARSVPLQQMLKLFFGSKDKPPVRGIQLFSFQVGAALDQLKTAPLDSENDVINLGDTFRDFDDTACALGQMDMVVTCDTSVAHLAGSMGVPTKLLVSNPPEWRWLALGSRSKWYGESLEIYRQETPRNWDTVLDAVLADLSAWADVKATRSPELKQVSADS